MISRWREAGGDPDSLPPAIRERLPAVFAASHFVFESATREPGIIAGLAASGELDRARTAGEIGGRCVGPCRRARRRARVHGRIAAPAAA